MVYTATIMIWEGGIHRDVQLVNNIIVEAESRIENTVGMTLDQLKEYAARLKYKLTISEDNGRSWHTMYDPSEESK